MSSIEQVSLWPRFKYRESFRVDDNRRQRVTSCRHSAVAYLKVRLPMSLRLNGTSRNGTADDRSDRVPLRALMCRLSYAGADVECQHGQLVEDALLHWQPMQFLQQWVRVIVLALDERSLRRCSLPAAACGWCQVECHGAQHCSSRSWKGSDYMQTSVRGWRMPYDAVTPATRHGEQQRS